LFARALAVDETWRTARIGLAESLWKMGNFDDARREFAQAGVAPPDSISGEPLQGFIDDVYQFTEDGDFKGALEYLDRTFPRDQDAPAEIWNTRAMVESGLRMWSRAADDLVKASAKDPQDPDWLYRAGFLAAEGGDTARAEDLYRQAIERYAAYAPARIELAYLALRQKDVRTAREQVLELEKIRIPADSIRNKVEDLRHRVDILEAEQAQE
jgi:tetratricopeptide (TPR) repeat protein